MQRCILLSVVLFSIHTMVFSEIQISNQQWYILRFQCGNEKTSRKLKLYKHHNCKKTNIMYVWSGGKKPARGMTEHLAHLGGDMTSRCINLTKRYFKVVAGPAPVFNNIPPYFGYKFIIQGGKYLASIRGTGAWSYKPHDDPE